MTDLGDFVEAVQVIVDRHATGGGGYARWTWQDAFGGRALGVNEYGCADAINLMYTLGTLPAAQGREELATALADRQDEASGDFVEATHDPVHTTAHCIAALEILDVKPRYPLRALQRRAGGDALKPYLEALDWRGNPWGESHKGAGAYAALVLAEEVDRRWQDDYFDWLWQEADPETGFWRCGCVESGGEELLFHHLAGSFHYLFNHEYARRPLRFPERMIDSCLRIYNGNLFPLLGNMVGFAEIDWVYCLNRARRQTEHRFAEVRDALDSFCDGYIAFLLGLDPDVEEGLNDLHQLFGAVCALAELQQALPGKIATPRPLRLVLDRRPFI